MSGEDGANLRYLPVAPPGTAHLRAATIRTAAAGRAQLGGAAASVATGGAAFRPGRQLPTLSNHTPAAHAARGPATRGRETGPLALPPPVSPRQLLRPLAPGL